MGAWGEKKGVYTYKDQWPLVCSLPYPYANAMRLLYYHTYYY